MQAAKILIVDDDRDILETGRMFLKQEFQQVDILEDPALLTTQLDTVDYDIILLDMNFTRGVNDGSEGFYWLGEIITKDPQIVVILITAYGEVDLAVKAMKNGATDFILKPWKNQKLLGTIHAALQLRKSKKEVDRLKQTQEKLSEDISNQFTDFIGQSPAIEHVRQLIDRVAQTDADVLILGENGTGKELVARSIHQLSSRANQVFISVDLGALTESLFEAELFGHTKGAFTNAHQDKAGRFELAEGGTIFLDEIGNLSMPLQAKLLTVLQQRKVQRVGSAKEIPVNVRLLSATNMPLIDMVQQNKFRQDLLYRINTVEIRVPALRERAEDIPLLVEHFMEVYSRKYKRPGMKIDKRVINQLKKYNWPGNIRELQHAIERAVILHDDKIVSDVGSLIHVGQSNSKDSEDTPVTLNEMERHFILQTLEQHDGNVSHTAKTLGVTRTALYRRLKKYGIE